MSEDRCKTALPRRVLHGFVFLLLGGALYWGAIAVLFESARAAADPRHLGSQPPAVPGGWGFVLVSLLAFANAAWGLILIAAGLIDYAKQRP